MKRKNYTIADYFRYSINYFVLKFYQVLILFGVKLSSKSIPEGLYCYEPDYVEYKSFVYHVKPCKYYKCLGHGRNGCCYLGVITDDFMFDDQCKLCGENNE